MVLVLVTTLSLHRIAPSQSLVTLTLLRNTPCINPWMLESSGTRSSSGTSRPHGSYKWKSDLYAQPSLSIGVAAAPIQMRLAALMGILLDPSSVRYLSRRMPERDTVADNDMPVPLTSNYSVINSYLRLAPEKRRKTQRHCRCGQVEGRFFWDPSTWVGERGERSPRP